MNLRGNTASSQPAVRMNITPMIDIVFLLLVFFILVSHVNFAVDAPVKLPSGVGGAVAKLPSHLVFNLDAQGRFLVGTEPVTETHVFDLIRKKIGQLNQSDANNSIRVELRTDQNCPSGRAHDFLESLAQEGVTSVQLSVQEEQR